MSLIHALSRGQLFGYVLFNRSTVIEEVFGSHSLVRNVTLQGVNPMLMGEG